MHKKIIAGVDLAWMSNKNPTAIAIGCVSSGVVELSSIFQNLYGTDAVFGALVSLADLHGVAIDGPLVITNQTGQRECERQIGVTYGGRKASCHTSNLGRFPDAAGVQLSARLLGVGFVHLASIDRKWQLECYPHPAMIEMFGLSERLAYKKGTPQQKRSGQIALGRLVTALKESNVLSLRIPEEFQIYLTPERIELLRGAQLKHNEDVLDAIICMYIGALYQVGHDKQIFGTTADGYICIPSIRCI